MLTNKDIQKIIQAHRKIWLIRDEYAQGFKRLQQDIKNLTLKINNLIEKYD